MKFVFLKGKLMQFKNISFFIILIALFFQACSTKNKPKVHTYNQIRNFPEKIDYNYKINNNLRYNNLYKALHLQYKNWKGVKYKFGGNTKKGIDCSAFVQKTFKDKLNIKIPRTTKLQSKTGYEVSKQNIKLGDLVFFKTGYNSRHVGIYLGKGKFLHASTKRGVTISRLNNPYYLKHFWKIKRVLY